MTLTRQQEQAELEAVFSSGTFAKSQNLARLLKYLCGKYFEGHANDLKEFSIGVEALGRLADFDPTSDSIVRVDLHRLREKLKRYYETEGLHDPVVIVLKPGNYAPQFLARSEVEAQVAPLETASSHGAAEALSAEVGQPVPANLSEPASPLPRRVMGWFATWRGRPLARFLMPTFAFIFLITFGVMVLWRSKLVSSQLLGPMVARLGGREVAAGADSGQEVRILAGYSKQSFIDRRGKVWQGDQYFKGGEPFATEQQTITRTLDPTIYRQSRVGEFLYDIPLKNGVYEMRLYFAETQFGPTTFAGGGESSRIFNIDMNGKPLLVDFDIYTSAGGSNVAYERVYKDVAPASDGYLHLKFRASSREKPLLNAMEIVPGTPGKLQPIRVVARDDSYTDHAGRIWSPDRYFLHGRLTSHTGLVQNTPDPDLYSAERFGNFDYAIPVAAGTYGVTLRFAETYFGALNSGLGGRGSRVFDVYCNGVTLLRSFDIFKEAGGANRALDKTFHGLDPNAQGLLKLSFVPKENYAQVNAIEVVDESE